ncbi:MULTISPECIES: hypothetical protein [Eisenbergiella]|uniref:hypothetical protein n=1 Tax=Eisenbergiella TaxID=1432051 RepID=UPI001F30D4B1|nr:MULTISPECIES: hypothetical protein [Eisenbergiella]
MGLFMLGSPFRELFALIISDGDADLPQHLLIELADRCSQRPNSGRGVEVENRHKIFVAEILFRLQSTAGHEGVGNADGSGGLKLYFDVKFIIFLKKRTVNDIAEVLLMLIPVFVRQFCGHICKLLGEVIAADFVGTLQHGRYGIHVPFLQLPQPGGTGMFTGSGVGNIEHIAQAGAVPGIVHQSDTLGAAPHIPAHLFIPQVVLCTGGSVRALGIDHQLLMERVLVKAGSSGEKPCPFLPAPRELRCHLVRHLCI